MTNKHDDELPGATIGGAQEKFLAYQDETGRYIPVEKPGPLRIPRHPAPPVDPAKVAAFTYEDAPPSIVDRLLADLSIAKPRR